ncbi:hypothetical protein [Bradyrhizobium liaoningense]|uniref:hypothetical protein n=1 Tax=Bradyrhizobium liaoningense TaxID=43992 RepID=UPI00201191E8|nr:hypothetical protein [Bradyrhizobium liaoningense]
MISVSRKDLELIALQEIRSFPGGELVIAVEIECDEGYPNGMNWRLDVTAADNADIDRIMPLGRQPQDLSVDTFSGGTEDRSRELLE